MEAFIEFDFLSENQDKLVIFGERNSFNVKFKAVNEFGEVVPKSKLSNSDIEEIHGLIYENAINEIEFESDAYDRQND
jgi:hypothetical protein